MRWLPTVLVLFTLGCGPIRSTVGIVEAEKAWKLADDAGAAQHAPYPFGLATDLLQKAREEQGFAAYSDAFILSRESKEQSHEALAISQGAAHKALAPATPASPTPEPETAAGSPTPADQAKPDSPTPSPESEAPAPTPAPSP